ncbi:MAG: hypothetical protein QG603_183 [Patescibacteria group bacterium]|nr:hypothetical protein [Patescibacteria group bacterium]MDQ5970406.1 hypothetical protein [Patescibacteria group bacterium]
MENNELPICSNVTCPDNKCPFHLPIHNYSSDFTFGQRMNDYYSHYACHGNIGYYNPHCAIYDSLLSLNEHLRPPKND